MRPIEFERWKPSADDPKKMEYDGQRTAQEVFEELKHRLESIGYLPDEYFLMDRAWEDGRKIPKDADIFCATDYGGSEGVYLDVYLKWHEEDGSPVQHLYAYEWGEDGKPRIIPEQAEVVRRIYDSFLSGRSVRMIKKELELQEVPSVKGNMVWSESVIRSILKNEKYCGDVLMQKTYTQDCISKKKLRNMGQLPMYLVQDNHEGIISRDTFNAVKAEFARRNAGRAPSQKLAPTGRSCYSAKYALTERLVCGECGTLYRRCVWTKRGQKFAVWRCASRVDYGTKYCHNSPTLHEEPLHAAILAAINCSMSQREVLVGQIEDAMRMELIPSPGSMSVSDIDRQLTELDKEFQTLFAKSKDGGFMKHAEDFKRISDNMAALKKQRADLLDRQNSNSAASRRIKDAINILNAGSAAITEWDESVIRQLVDTVKVLSADRIRVYLRGGAEIEQKIETR